jgi:hypothetical protein
MKYTRFIAGLARPAIADVLWRSAGWLHCRTSGSHVPCLQTLSKFLGLARINRTIEDGMLVPRNNFEQWPGSGIGSYEWATD